MQKAHTHNYSNLCMHTFKQIYRHILDECKHCEVSLSKYEMMCTRIAELSLCTQQAYIVPLFYDLSIAIESIVPR